MFVSLTEVTVEDVVVDELVVTVETVVLVVLEEVALEVVELVVELVVEVVEGTIEVSPKTATTHEFVRTVSVFATATRHVIASDVPFRFSWIRRSGLNLTPWISRLPGV